MTDRNYRTGKEYTRERRKVLRALVTKHNLTLAEAGALYGLTKQRVSQILRERLA